MPSLFLFHRSIVSRTPSPIRHPRLHRDHRSRPCLAHVHSKERGSKWRENDVNWHPTWLNTLHMHQASQDGHSLDGYGLSGIGRASKSQPASDNLIEDVIMEELNQDK